MKKKRRSGIQKERIIMLGASMFVLSALTLTGVYVRESNKQDEGGYIVDFSKLEEDQNEIALVEENQVKEADLPTQRANSGNIEIPSLDTPVKRAVEDKLSKVADADSGDEQELAVEAVEEVKAVEVDAEEVEVISTEVTYEFTNDDVLQWPIAGNVLLNYSMDKTIYFNTLEQYKYNPAIIIQASKGDPIVAAANGVVESVFIDDEIGSGFVMEVGNGYQLTYGQLENIVFEGGQQINKGDIVGYVSEPSKYYSIEGYNVYFKLEKDGIPVNPMSQME